MIRVAYPLTLTFKFLTISSYIRVLDATGQLVSYVKQRAFRLKEDVTIFAERRFLVEQEAPLPSRLEPLALPAVLMVVLLERGRG